MLTSLPLRNANPAGFQYTEPASSAKPAPASPIPLARELGEMRRNGTAEVPPWAYAISEPTAAIANPANRNINVFMLKQPPQKI
jgi:hypothetical protein